MAESDQQWRFHASSRGTVSPLIPLRFVNAGRNHGTQRLSEAPRALTRTLLEIAHAKTEFVLPRHGAIRGGRLALNLGMFDFSFVKWF